MTTLDALAARWREEADLLRRRGAEAQADVLLGVAAELREALDTWRLETLTLEDAAEESGYSYSGLHKLLSQRPDLNAGDRHRPRIRRGDLPRRPPPRGPRVA